MHGLYRVIPAIPGGLLRRLKSFLRQFQQEQVDPVMAWDGLIMHMAPGPSGRPMRTLPPGSVVTMLVETATEDGASWQWVQDSASGDQGWGTSAICGPLSARLRTVT